jgi:hypothetical protein
MGFFSDLGKSIKGIFSPEKSKMETKQVGTFDPNQQKIWDNMAKTSPYFNTGVPRTHNTGPTQEELAYKQTLMNYYGDATRTTNQDFDKSNQRIGQNYDPTAAMNRVQQNFQNVALPNWQQNVQPIVQSEYAGPGYWGTARANAVGNSLNSLNQQAMSEMYSIGNQYDMKRADALTGSEQLRQEALQRYLGMKPTLAAEQANLSQQWLDRKNPNNDPYYQQALTMLGQQPIQVVGGTTQTGAGLGYGLIQGIAKGAGSALAGG